MTLSDSGFKLDLHNHTAYSLDGLMSPRELLALGRERGLHYLAVTDHNTVEGALEALALAEEDRSLPRVIPGVEVSTRAGEVIGLFVETEIPSGLSLAETVEQIRAQGGLVYLPHPCDRLRRGAVSKRARGEALQLADLVEVANGRSLSKFAGLRSTRLAQRAARPAAAGSDAHRPREVGQAYVVVDRPPTREDLVSLVRAGTVVHRLGLREYAMNWVVQGLAPFTRARRRLASVWARRLAS